jgi:hypothetical protein
MDLGGSCANLLLWIEGVWVELVSENGGNGCEASDGNGFPSRLDFKRKHGHSLPRGKALAPRTRTNRSAPDMRKPS